MAINKYRKELLEALNRMDEKVEEMGEDLEGRQEQSKDYNLIYEFIESRI